MFLAIILLISLGISSFIYSSFIMQFISNIISVETQSMILMFSCILLLLDNFSLFHDLNTNNINNTTDNNVYIKVLLNQTIELQKNKLLIEKLTKQYEKKQLSKSFSSSFD
jgi:hypothetical protein